jgi:DNA-binding transcriptional LysR family regulator
MDMRQLEYFQMVSRLKSITRAAEQLHVAQPSITIAIKKLEDELGIQLFDRSQKQFALTAEGQVFLQRVESILRSLQEAITEMGDYRQLQRGTIKLGIPPMIGTFLFPQIFVDFQKQFPQLKLSIIEGGSLAVREQLEKRDLDLGIIILAPDLATLATVPLTTCQIHVCLPPDHPLCSQATISFSQLKDQPFILLNEGTYHRQMILDQCAKHHFTPHILLSSSQIETIRALVAKGVGISFFFDVIARKTDAIVSRPLSDPLNIQIGLAWNKDKYLSHASQAFIGFITQLAQLGQL